MRERNKEFLHAFYEDGVEKFLKRIGMYNTCNSMKMSMKTSMNFYSKFTANLQ